jgi:EmrB/QacA subfamily drug resistance transporter
MNSISTTVNTAEHNYDIFYKHKKKLYTIIAALMTAMLLSALDQMVFSTALPTIVGELDGVNHMLWVTTAYILAATVSMPLYGKLSDLIGRKSLLIFGVFIFIVGSIVGGLATDMTWLIIARGIQGIGGGGLMILSQAVIADVIPIKQRPKYMGFIGATFALSSVLGPLLGGWFTEGPGWRWAFWINVPLGIIALIVVVLFLKTPHVKIPAKFDIFGTITMTIAVTSLVLFTSWGGNEHEWNSVLIISLIAAFVIFTALFIIIENKVSDPLIPMRLFKDKNFTIASVAGLIVGIGMFGSLAYLPTYLQMVNGMSATNSGLLLLPMIAGLMVSTLVSGAIVTKTGNYKWSPIIGFLLVILALFLFSTMTPETQLFQSSIYMVIMGLGIGAVMQILVTIIQNSVSHKEVGVATATNNFFREIGASLGGAFVGGLFSSKLTELLSQNLPAGAAGGDNNSLTPAVVNSLPDDIKNIIIEAYNDSFTPVFAYLIPVFAIGLIFLFFIKQQSMTEIENIESNPITNEIHVVSIASPMQLPLVEDEEDIQSNSIKSE